MGRLHLLTPKTSKANKWNWRKSMHVTNQRTDSMVMSCISTPLTPLTEGWQHTRSVERRTNFEPPYFSLITPQVPRSFLHSLSGNLQSPVVSRGRQGSNSVSIIRITRKPGWPWSFLKSESVVLGEHWKMWQMYLPCYRWIRMFDDMMQAQKRKVCLHLNNFSGHYISYKPTNVELIYFKLNLTAWVQPLDAGIIRCFKAHYWRRFCQEALKRDISGKADIYSFNLLKTLHMAHNAWDNVTPETIKNCWNHTNIQRDPIILRVLLTLTQRG